MKLERLKNEKFSNERIEPHRMGLVFGGKKVYTVWVKDKLHDYYEDENNNGKQDKDECLVFIAPTTNKLSE